MSQVNIIVFLYTILCILTAMLSIGIANKDKGISVLLTVLTVASLSIGLIIINHLMP